MFLACGPGCRELFCFRYTTTSPGRNWGFMLHSAPFYPHPQDGSRIPGWRGCAAKEVRTCSIHIDTRDWRKEKPGIWLENAVIPSHHDHYEIPNTIHNIAV